jgi:simple sugar transport system permease protein
MMEKMPAWADVVLVPLISLLLAAAISALVIMGIGEDPMAAVKMMVSGALGSTYGWGYTLYYATNFMFTGLAVSVAFHAKMFNIGGEGQAMIGGLGVALMALFIPWPHWSLALIFCSIGGAVFGALWALIPAILQAKRGSHIVITTIMFNFMAAALLNYLLVSILRPVKSMDPATASFPEPTHLPTLHDILMPLGIEFSKSAPANVSLLLALAAAVFVWVLIWRTRLGYALRAFGHSDTAAQYAGINPVKITILAMLISGGLAGMMAVNTTLGEAERLSFKRHRRRGLYRHRRRFDGAQPSFWRGARLNLIWILISRRRRIGALDIDPTRVNRGDPSLGYLIHWRAG